LDDYSTKKKIHFQRMQQAEGNQAESKEVEEAREDEVVKDTLRHLLRKREKGEDYRVIDIDPARIKKEKEQAVESKDLNTEKETVNSVPREAKQFKDKSDKMDVEKGQEKRDDDEEHERERKVRLERERELEREERRREREEREFREREKEWEARERAREREREKDRQRLKLDRDRDVRDMAYDDSERKKRSREYYRNRKDREKEKIEDEQDKLRDLQEEEYKRREQDRLREREQMEQDIQMDRFQPPPPPMESPPPVTTPTRDEKEGILDPSMIDKLVFSAPSEKKTLVSIVPGFNAEPEVDELYTKKKRKLITLEKSLHVGNNRQVKLEHAKVIIEMIPIDKIKLFEYPMAWDVIEKHNIVEGKMRLWIKKKIKEYLGEEDPTLTDFILTKIAAHKSPTEILDQLALVLDEEAEGFVIKLWRALLFEMLGHQQVSENNS